MGTEKLASDVKLSLDTRELQWDFCSGMFVSFSIAILSLFFQRYMLHVVYRNWNIFKQICSKRFTKNKYYSAVDTPWYKNTKEKVPLCKWQKQLVEKYE